MLEQVFVKRFESLTGDFNKLRFNEGGYSEPHVDPGDWMRWATSAQNLIKSSIGEASPYYENFVKAMNACQGWQSEVLTLRGIFLAAREDFEGGHVFNVDLRVSGEVFGDFVALAKMALQEQKIGVAGVLACAALEDALKRFAIVNGLDVDGRAMQDVVNALKGAGLIAGAQKTILDSMPRIRNIALHGEWDKLSSADVGSVIGFVEQFLLANFGS